MRNRRHSLGIGIIGCGYIAERMHLPAALRVPEANVIAAADIDADQLESVANRFNIERRYGDYTLLLNDPEVEAVVVCVPLHLHAEIGLDVLDAGKHLLLEKPIAISLEDADQLIAGAAGSSSVTMVGFNLRWHRLIRRAREIIHQGTLGKVKAIRCMLSGQDPLSHAAIKWRKRRELGGGMLVDGAIHHFDLWRFLINDEVEEVFAISRQGKSDDEVISVSVRFASGVTATGSYAMNTGTEHEIEIFGSKGHLQINGYRFDGLRVFPMSSRPGDLATRLAGVANTLWGLPGAFCQRSPTGDLGFSFQGEWRHFIACIRQDTPVGCTLLDGRRALEIVLAAAQSASIGRPVKVTEAPNRITPVNQ